MPVEPDPSCWRLVPADDEFPGDAWAVGGDLEPGTIVTAYRLGLFPMRSAGSLAWWSPVERAVIPLDRRSPRSVRRARRAYEIRVDTAFEQVILGCADPRRPHGWIDAETIDAYSRLYRLGWVHSIEAWDEHGLAGGLYGVAVGGLFAAESMFHHRTGASKAALAGLVELLVAAGDPSLRLLDVQWLTPQLASLGAQGMTRAEYHRRLARALPLAQPFSADG